MTNTQSLLDRMAAKVRYFHNEVADKETHALLAEYEAHKASHFEDTRDMVKARQFDAVPVIWQYYGSDPDDLGNPEKQWFTASKDTVEFMAERSYETRALGVIDPIQPGSTTS